MTFTGTGKSVSMKTSDEELVISIDGNQCRLSIDEANYLVSWASRCVIEMETCARKKRPSLRFRVEQWLSLQ